MYFRIDLRTLPPRICPGDRLLGSDHR